MTVNVKKKAPDRKKMLAATKKRSDKLELFCQAVEFFAEGLGLLGGEFE